MRRTAATIAVAVLLAAGTGAWWLHGAITSSQTAAKHPPLCQGCPAGRPMANWPLPSGLMAAAVENLDRRPLKMPRLLPGAGCAISQTRSLTAAGLSVPGLGPGPFYAALPDGFKAGTFERVGWVLDPHNNGPAVVRGGRLDGQGTLLLSLTAVSFPLGRTVSTGAQAMSTAVAIEPEAHVGWWNAVLYGYATEPGCYGWQVDGVGFSYHIIFPVT